MQTSLHAARRAEFIAGAKAQLPFIPGVVAFGLLTGAVTVSSGLSDVQTIVLSTFLFAGNSQVVSMQLYAGGAPVLVVVLACLVVNLRHLMYGMSLAPHFRDLPLGLKMLLAFLMVDQVFALSLKRYTRDAQPLPRDLRVAYYLGVALLAMACWALPCAAGALVGARLPPSWRLDLIPSLGLIALIVPNLRDMPALAAAGASAVAATLLNFIPLRGGVLIAGVLAIVVGLAVEARRPAEARP